MVTIGRLGRSSINDCHDIVLRHDDDILVIDFDLRPAVFAEEHAIAHFDVERAGLPAVQHLASAYGDDFAEGGLFAGCVRNDDPAGRLTLCGLALDGHPIVQRTNVHDTSYV